MRGLALSSFLLVGVACGQSISAVTDGASFGPRIAPGELATIFGASLASGTAQPSSTPLPTTLNGTTVLVNSIQAPLVYVSAAQINFQVPSSVTTSPVTVQVNTPSGSTPSVSVELVLQGPAIFQYAVNRAVAQNANGKLNSSTSPAAANSVITVYLTGQGAVNNAVADGTAAPSSPLSTATATATATIGVQNAPVQFLGLAPGFVGLAQANIQLPNLPAGDYPLVIVVGGAMSTSAVISITNSGTYTSPLTLVGQANFGNDLISNVVLYANTAYVCGQNQITMVDVTTPSAPTVLGSFGTAQLGGLGTTCVVNSTAGSDPFLVDVVGYTNSFTTSSPVASSFAVWDLLTPTAPILITVAQTSYAYITSLSFLGLYGFATSSFFSFNSNDVIVGQDGTYLAFSFGPYPSGNSISPVAFIGGTATQPMLEPYAAVLNSAFSYIAGSTGTGTNVAGTGLLSVMSLTSGSGTAPIPQLINSVVAPPSAILLSLDISNDILLAAGNTTENRDPGNPNFAFTGHLTLTTFNIDNQEGPYILASFDTGMPVDGTPTTRAFSNNVFAVISNSAAPDVTGPASLSILDARGGGQTGQIGSSPLLYPFLTEFGLSGALATSGGYLLAPTVHGLNIYTLNLQ
jgi:uncharacterized protein (TIGR03437 family)